MTSSMHHISPNSTLLVTRRDTQQLTHAAAANSSAKCKRFVVNDLFIVLARALCEHHYSVVIAEKKRYRSG